MVMQESSARPEGSCTRGISDLGLHSLHGKERLAWSSGSGMRGQAADLLYGEGPRSVQCLFISENLETELAQAARRWRLLLPRTLPCNPHLCAPMRGFT